MDRPWDMEELMAKKDEIVEEDKLKMRMAFRSCQFGSKGSGACVNSNEGDFNCVLTAQTMHRISR